MCEWYRDSFLRACGSVRCPFKIDICLLLMERINELIDDRLWALQADISENLDSLAQLVQNKKLPCPKPEHFLLLRDFAEKMGWTDLKNHCQRIIDAGPDQFVQIHLPDES